VGTLSRRTVLRGTSAAIALATSTGYAAKGRLAVVGMGRIQDPIEGVTVPSPSDFGPGKATMRSIGRGAHS